MSTEALAEWIQHHGGFFHREVAVTTESGKGRCTVASADLEKGAEIVKVPHICSLSALNALVDTSVPVLQANAGSFPLVSLGVFYLMYQWLNKGSSFYKPFLDILPTPEDGFGTPFWFDDTDMQWLNGTDLETSFRARDELWHKYWRDGTAVLQDGGMDVSQYTWDLCKWAATIFSSRSIPSRSLAAGQQQDPIWTTFAHDSGSSQPAVHDFSDDTHQDRFDFPVLMPLMDLLNHAPSGKVDWVFSPGLFELNLASAVSECCEVYNNYGPKSNSELLLGYGFCIPGNPHDIVYEALKPPPAALQQLLESSPSKLTFAKELTFGLRRWPGGEADVWDSIPEDLLQRLHHLTLFDRGLLLVPSDLSLPSSTFDRHASATLPTIAHTLVRSLAPKIDKLSRTAPEVGEDAVLGARASNARMYREGQVGILLSLAEGLRGYTRSLRPGTATLLRDAGAGRAVVGGVLLTLGQLLALVDTLGDGGAGWQLRAGLAAIFTRPGQGDEEDLDVAAEAYAWAVSLCFLAMLLVMPRGDGSVLAEDERRKFALGQHIRLLADTYGVDEFEADGEGEGAHDGEGDEEDETAARALQGIRLAAGIASTGDGSPSIWQSQRWTQRCILDWGLRVARSQGMLMNVEDEGGVRFVVYLHAT